MRAAMSAARARESGEISIVLPASLRRATYLSDSIGKYMLCGVGVLERTSSKSCNPFFVASFPGGIDIEVNDGAVGVTSSSLHSIFFLARAEEGPGDALTVML